MTREEAIKMAKADLKCMERDTSGQDEMCNSHKCDECSLNYERGNMGEQKEWLRMAIQALEQEPCDVPDTNVGDIISKQTVLDTISELNAVSFYEAQEDSRETYYEIRQAIKDLSPVKQEPKTGHWILKIEDWNKWICSKCGYTERTDIHVSLGYDFCPKCGAKMSENPTDSKDVIWYSKRNYSVIVVEPQKRSEE